MQVQVAVATTSAVYVWIMRHVLTEESRGERRGRGMAEAKGGSQEAKQLPVFSQTPQQDEVVEKEIREAKRLVQS